MIKDIVFYILFFTLSFLAGHFLPSYFKRKGQNRADKEDIFDIKYLEEKGVHLHNPVFAIWKRLLSLQDKR